MRSETTIVVFFAAGPGEARLILSDEHKVALELNRIYSQFVVSAIFSSIMAKPLNCIGRKQRLI